MAQPLIKFFRVAKLTDLQATQKVQGGLYFETSTGVLYVYNGTDFEAYSGLKSATYADQKLVLTPSVGAAIEIDLSGYVDNGEFNTELAKYVKKEQTIAGIDLQDNITSEELKTALGLTDKNLGGEANVLEGVKVNGEALTIAADKTVDILVAEGSTDGTIAVNGKDVAVHGLGSAAYTESTAYDAAGAAETVQTALVNGETEFTDFKAVGDELRALDLAAGAKVADVTVGGTSVVNTNHVAVLGTAAGKAIEDFDAAGAATTALENANKYTDGVKNAIIGDATTAGDTLGKLEDRIEAIVTNEKTYSVVKLTADEVTALGNSNVKEAYKLIDEDKATVGDPILIYKDSSLKSAAMGTGDNAQKLMLTYILADGSESEVPVDLSAFYAESETGNGLQLINHVISVKRDDASEAFLTVSENGVKLSGVADAIATAVAAEAEIARAAEKANADAIAAEVTRATAAEEAIAANLATLDAEVQEHERVVAGALNDLNDRLVTAESSVADHETRLTTAEGEIDALQAAVGGLDLGVKTVTGQGGDYVTVTPAEASKGDVTVSVSVTTTKSTNTAYANDALATDGYVDEKAAAAQAAAEATAAADATSKANTAESNAKTYADNLMSWASF